MMMLVQAFHNIHVTLLKAWQVNRRLTVLNALMKEDKTKQLLKEFSSSYKTRVFWGD